MSAFNLALRGLEPAEQTVSALLQRQANRWGERPLAAVGADRLSYSDAPKIAAACAASLKDAGIGRGDRVAMMCSNRMEFIELFLGCAWLGAVAVPLNTALRGRQLEHALSNSGTTLLMIDSELMHALEAIERPPTLRMVWALGEGAHPGGDYVVVSVPQHTGELAPAEVVPSETVAILYTSGTTGPSKGVCVPQAQMYWWAICAAGLLEVDAEDVLFNPLPLFHINALSTLFSSLVTGANCVFGERFSASRFWSEVRDNQATVIFVLGAMSSILIATEPGPDDRAHRARVALAPATQASLFEPFKERFGVQLVEGYGSTETNATIGAQPGEQRPGYIGYVRDGFEAKVVDSDDVEVPDGEPGELVFRHSHPNSFSTGYFEMPERTVEAWRNLWFHTGDQVVRDADGWFRFLDRGKDGIRRRGENISSFEVEEALLDHEAIASAAVFAVPSEVGEDEVMATVVVKAGTNLDPVELMKHCEPRLAYFAIPRYVDIVDALPVTENGKVRKSELRERGVGEQTWDREASGYTLRRR